MTKVLLVEDNEVLSEETTACLTDEGFEVTQAFSGEAAEELLESSHFDILILDWELPVKSGLELSNQFRQSNRQTPILFLTARSSLKDKEAGFGSGADDYLAKPFLVQELIFRIRALLRRSSNFTEKNALKVRELTLEPHKYRVSLNDKELRLLPKEFAVLEFLMRHPGEIFSPEALMNRLWEPDTNISTDAVSVCVRRLRRKIDTNPSRPLLSNIHGVGYRLEPN